MQGINKSPSFSNSSWKFVAVTFTCVSDQKCSHGCRHEAIPHCQENLFLSNKNKPANSVGFYYYMRMKERILGPHKHFYTLNLSPLNDQHTPFLWNKENTQPTWKEHHYTCFKVQDLLHTNKLLHLVQKDRK